VSPLTLVLIVASVMLGIGLLAVLAWLVSTSYLNYVERRLARRKGLYRDLVAELAARERALLEPEIRRLATLLDLEALEAVLEEQARAVAVNLFAVLVGAWRFRFGLADRHQRGLLPFGRRRDVLILLLYAVLENFGYRQLTLYWRVRGLWDAWRGKTGWEKFARVGFREGVVPAHG
jgi:hypothetical protein